MFRLLLLSTALAASTAAIADDDHPFIAEPVAEFDQPWATAFLPDGKLLVTEKPGRLFLVDRNGDKVEVGGVPDVDYGGQGGLGDVALHPDFEQNGLLYLSYAEAGADRMRGAAVAVAKLDASAARPTITEPQVIWRQVPKLKGKGHYGHARIKGIDKTAALALPGVKAILTATPAAQALFCRDPDGNTLELIEVE